MISGESAYAFLTLPLLAVEASTLIASLSINPAMHSLNSLFLIWEEFIRLE